VREGRAIYDNIRNVIGWTLPANGGESIIIVGAILAGMVLPITPIQILWINLVTAVALGLTLAFEPPQPGIMRRSPRPPRAPLLDAATVWRMVLVSALMAAFSFLVFDVARARGDELAYARTLVVNLIVGIAVFYLYSVRYVNLREVTVEGILGTRAVLIGVGTTILLQGGFTYLPWLQAVFETRPLAAADVVLVLAVGFGLLLLLEAEKGLRLWAGTMMRRPAARRR
jgi:magnesium-transporting ATPase (P-type)